MRAINPQTLTLDFTGLTRECPHCEDGKSYHWAEDCKVCTPNGRGLNYRRQGRVLKNGRWCKCTACNGDSYIRLELPACAGECTRCKGTRTIPVDAFSAVSKEDAQWIWDNLFNLEKPYTGQNSAFNEQYLGFGLYAGVTDYGRHAKMTPEQFREEVYNNWMRGRGQYITLVRKSDMRLPDEVLIRRGSSGWHAYPVWNS